MKIAIIGVGKMGAWLADLLSKNYEVAVFDLDGEAVRKLKRVTVLDEISDLSGFGPDLLVNAVSLENIIQAFDAALPHIPSRCIISDIASIKNSLEDYYKKSGFEFASVHPMFGPTFAKMDELGEKHAVIIKESGARGADFFKALFSGLSLNIFEYTFEEHDKMMAYSLSLPFASSMVFASCVDPAAVPGTTFGKHKKIARGVLMEDDHLLSEILFNPFTEYELERVINALEHLKELVKSGAHDRAEEFFDKLRENLG
ncbi:MAG: prephenate dehydrogenase/arogenate dehydrogenase family protein [Chloroflexi bacterium]|nr:prephenate dehydrogenase/arogenate dehydrogenase family protein [Chloroflexota bacterium]